MLKVLLCAAAFLCYVQASYGNAIDIAAVQEDAQLVCEPRKTYVAWKSVRNYLVHQHGKFTIPGTWVGEPLEVLRCRDFLHPCRGDGFYCGTGSEEIRTTHMPVTEGGKRIANLTLNYVQDAACKCSMEKPIVDSVESPPYIFQSSVEMI